MKRMIDAKKPLQTMKICAMTALCLAIMLGISAVKREQAGAQQLQQEYSADDGSPRYVEFEAMPADAPQKTVALFFKYQGMAQYEQCRSLVAADQITPMNFKQQEADFKDGCYIQEYIVHSFATLPVSEYGDMEEHYRGLSALHDYEEYQIVRVTFTQRWTAKALEKAPQWGDGQYTRDFAVGKEKGRNGAWKIFELGMM